MPPQIEFPHRAFDRSRAFFRLSSTTPARILVPPISTPRMASCAWNIQVGASCGAPSSPASSGSLRIGMHFDPDPSALRITPARPIASSPTRLERKPPPTMMRSVSRQPLVLRKRRVISASSWAKSSIAPCSRPAALGIAIGEMESSFFLLMSSLGSSPKGPAVLAHRLAPVFQDVAEGALAGAVAEEALVILELEVIAVELHRRQASAPWQATVGAVVVACSAMLRPHKVCINGRNGGKFHSPPLRGNFPWPPIPAGQGENGITGMNEGFAPPASSAGLPAIRARR